MGETDMQTQLRKHTRLSSFVFLTMIGATAYLIATAGFHSYTASTALLPIMIFATLLKVSGQQSAGQGEAALTHFAVVVAALVAGLVFALLYWPIEIHVVRPKYPRGIRAGRMIAGFLFFLFVSLAFPLSEAL
jgi:hypothetical protein